MNFHTSLISISFDSFYYLIPYQYIIITYTYVTYIILYYIILLYYVMQTYDNSFQFYLLFIE